MDLGVEPQKLLDVLLLSGIHSPNPVLQCDEWESIGIWHMKKLGMAKRGFNPTPQGEVHVLRQWKGICFYLGYMDLYSFLELGI